MCYLALVPSTIIVALAMRVPLRTPMMGDQDGKRDPHALIVSPSHRIINAHSVLVSVRSDYHGTN